MLQRLEGGPAVRVDGDDLAIDDGLTGNKTASSSGNARISQGHVLVVPRSNLQPFSVLQQQRAIAIELDLVAPVGALGKLGNDAGGHGLHEPWRVAID